jgi:hypothetical protein
MVPATDLGNKRSRVFPQSATGHCVRVQRAIMVLALWFAELILPHMKATYSNKAPHQALDDGLDHKGAIRTHLACSREFTLTLAPSAFGVSPNSVRCTLILTTVAPELIKLPALRGDFFSEKITSNAPSPVGSVEQGVVRRSGLPACGFRIPQVKIR